MGNIGLTFLGILLFLASTFMMLLILVQRGKGGGLTGALGGMGGQSAFGAKAGDVFTRVTVVTAIIWITLCMVTIAAYNPPPRKAELDPEDNIPAILAGEEEEKEKDELEGTDATNDSPSADGSEANGATEGENGTSLEGAAQESVDDRGNGSAPEDSPVLEPPNESEPSNESKLGQGSGSAQGETDGLGTTEQDAPEQDSPQSSGDK